MRTLRLENDRPLTAVKQNFTDIDTQLKKEDTG